MSIILSIETSGTTGSVALTFDGRCVGTTVIYKAFSHSAMLGRSSEQLLENCGIVLRDVTNIALSDGPGSYTGLRIGAAYAKGICYGLGVPLLPIPTHLAMASQFLSLLPDGAFIVAMQDARRMEVYQTIYQVVAGMLVEVSPCTNHILTVDSYAEIISGPKASCYFIGDGAQKWQLMLQNKQALQDRFIFIPAVVPLAETIGQIATSLIKHGSAQPTTDIVNYIPNYLKPWIGNQTTPKPPAAPQFRVGSSS
jgi:tRNA threonylcarbamoyladenosine biosynthesis protein TsaB